jgi:hypothetical protein
MEGDCTQDSDTRSLASEDDQGKTPANPCGGKGRARQVQEARYVIIPQETTARIFLTSTAAGQQSLLINGAIGLQVIVGAITTGVAAASTNVPPSHPILAQSCSTDTLINRSGLPSPFSVEFLPH